MKGSMLTLCFLLGFFGGTIGKLAYEHSVLFPYEWKYDPIVINCVGPSLSESYMMSAIDYWTIRGHHIESYYHNPPDKYCQFDGVMPGFIVIRRPKLLELAPTTLASTSRHIVALQIVGAEIVFKRSSLDLELVYIHELGHAIGYGHVEIEGHIMHPTYERMGDSFYIP